MENSYYLNSSPDSFQWVGSDGAILNTIEEEQEILECPTPKLAKPIAMNYRRSMMYSTVQKYSQTKLK